MGLVDLPNLSAEELATVWLGLCEYKTSLESSLMYYVEISNSAVRNKKHGTNMFVLIDGKPRVDIKAEGAQHTNLEDQVFLYTQLADVTNLLLILGPVVRKHGIL